MTDRIALAARNNALWCDAVCRSHGLVGIIDEQAWTSPRRTPPYYPDAVTLSPDAGAYDVLARVDPSDGCSVKDSWSVLDLTSENFARLVVGEWLWWDAPEAPDQPTDWRPWQRVEAADDMAAWTRAWASDPEDALILPTSLLAEPGVHVLAARDDGFDPVAGCIVNVTGSVAGVSNTFSRGPHESDAERTWRDVVAAARQVAGPLPLVGWDAGAGVEAAVSAGAQRLGPLSVWIS